MTTESIENPVLAALERLTNDELAALIATNDQAEKELTEDGVIWAFYTELGRLLRAERMARQGGTQPGDTNNLWLIAGRLDRQAVEMILAALHHVATLSPMDGVRDFAKAVGLLLSLHARQGGQAAPERLN